MNKNYTSIKTSKLLAEVSGVETEMMWYKSPQTALPKPWLVYSKYTKEARKETAPAFKPELTYAYTFTDLLAVIDEIGKNKKDVCCGCREKQDVCICEVSFYPSMSFSQHKSHELLDAYTADGSVMNKENGEVKKFIINLIK